MKRIVNMSDEDHNFILNLLHETKDDFRKAFQELAKSESFKGKRKFVAYWCAMAELAFTKAEEGGEQC